MNILGYSCVSACGQGAEAFWKCLYEGTLNLAEDKVFRIKSDPYPTSTQKMGEQLLQIYSEIKLQQASASGSPDGLGIILATTKGSIEDSIWNKEKANSDSLYPVLEYFLEKSNLNPVLSTCLSNACASSHGALFMAKLWLETKKVSQVLVLAVDEVGPFIYKGFKSLGALSQTSAQPFSAARDGLSLGEAAAGILVSLKGESDFEIDQIAMETEGHSITRPSTDGKRMECLVSSIKSPEPIDVIVAHGTATKFNDLTEDKVFSALLPEVPVTASKWCIGHTLGASGLMDLIASIGILKFQRVFALATTETIDPGFKANYVTEKDGLKKEISRVLLTSLGFGGMQAAMTVKRGRK